MILKIRCNTIESIPVVKGLTVYNQDCGPILALNIGYYINWIDSIVIDGLYDKYKPIKPNDNSNQNDLNNIAFEDFDLESDDECILPNGARGLCVEASNCNNSPDQRSILLCRGSDNIICCRLNGTNNIVDKNLDYVLE